MGKGVSDYRSIAILSLTLAVCMASSPPGARAADLAIGSVYECPRASSFRVIQCAGDNPGDLCLVETSLPGKPPAQGQSLRAQVMELVPLCHVRGAKAGAVSSSGQVDANGFRVGEEVNAATAGGWAVGRIVSGNGDSYRVNLSGIEVSKTYPTELRRLGKLNDVDRARGLFALHDEVQVKVEGKWVPGEVIAELGMDYNVSIPGNRSVWAPGRALRRVANVAGAASAGRSSPATGSQARDEAPKPGMKSCAGKVEGRYATTGGVGGFQITFRSGKALLSALAGDDEMECWTDGRKIVLHKAGTPSNMDMPIDINDDGSLQTPMGDIHKKGS